MNNQSVVATASNLRKGENPSFTLSDFYGMYPQFDKDSQGNQVIPEPIIETYLYMAHSCIKESRWHKSWKVGMSLYIAHFCTLYAQGVADANAGINGIVEAGKSKGLDTSVSVGDVSVSTDYSIATSNIQGYTGWNLTFYGQQFIQLARLYGKGGMMII